LFLLSLFIPGIFLVIGLALFSSLNLLLFGFLIVFLLALYPDKILLLLFKIKKNNFHGWAENYLKNVSYQLEVKKYSVFTTEGKNIYTLDGIFTHPRIIIGEEFLEFFSKEESEALIFASILRIKNKDSRFRCLSSLFIDIFFLPFIKIPSQNLKISFLSFRYLIRSYFYKNKSETKNFDKNLGPHRIPFASALFKLNMQNDKGNFFLEDCTFSEAKTDQIIRYFFDNGYDFNTRYQDLLRENGKA